MNPPGAQPRLFATPLATLALVAAAAVALLPLACNGCHGSPPASTNGNNNAPIGIEDAAANATAGAGTPTVRLYLISDLAGAIEPCGCTKDQLGGMDHFAALVDAQKKTAPSFATVAAGPLFFMDATLKPDRADQETTKADTMARALKDLGFAAFAPADNDWAAGRDKLATFAKDSGGAMLLANAGGSAGAQATWVATTVRAINGVKVGFIGVGQPPSAEAPGGDAGVRGDAGARGSAGASADAGASASINAAVAKGVADLKAQGANVLIALASVGRGDAKRIADAVPELTAIVVGSRESNGDANTQAPPAERVGNVLIAQAANHLQSVGMLDLYVRGGSYQFADATGIERDQKRAELTRRIDDLHVKIANWERDRNIPARDLEARRADLERLQRERESLDVAPPPASGSFFRYTVKEIRTSMGSDPDVAKELSAYYKAVNEHNKIAFADRLPVPHSGDQATYVGVAACSSCHKNAVKFWETTGHAHAYKTLSDQFKEYNLDCVSCHVTGYEQPGGSTVTHVDRLQNVQCEVCHGPGSKHGLHPEQAGLIEAHPKPDACLSCHHPPHVEQFDATAKMAQILGPGHGKPMP